MTDQCKEEDAAIVRRITIGLTRMEAWSKGFAAGRAAERAEIVAMVEAMREAVIDDAGFHVGFRMACAGVIRRLTSEETDAK